MKISLKDGMLIFEWGGWKELYFFIQAPKLWAIGYESMWYDGYHMRFMLGFLSINWNLNMPTFLLDKYWIWPKSRASDDFRD